MSTEKKTTVATNPRSHPVPFGLSARRREAIAAAALVALTLVVYIPSMGGDFIWDDTGYFDIDIRPNVQPRVIRAEDGLRDIWFSRKLPDYWPLTNTMFWLEWRLWGENPMGYRVVNIMLHALSAAVIWRVLRRLALPGAYVAATIFAVHPVAIASAAWITEGKNTLSLLLCALSVLAYLRYEDAVEAARRSRWRWYAAALGLFLLALLAKTSMVMLPLLLPVLSWWRRKRITSAHLLRLVPFLFLSAMMGMVTILFQHQNTTAPPVPSTGLFERIAASGWCVWFYLTKSLLPIGLSAIYPRWDVDPTRLTAWGPLLALVVVAVVAWRYRDGWGRSLLAMLVAFVLLLLPVLGLIEMAFHKHSLVADHLQYLAVIVPVSFVVAAVVCMGGKRRRWAATLAGLVVIAALAGLSWKRAGVYTSDERLWRDRLAKNPQSDAAHRDLGTALAAQGRYAEAIRHYRAALDIHSTNAQTHLNLGQSLASLGNAAEAIRHYRVALDIRFADADAHYNLGQAHESLGNVAEAIRHYHEALQIDPRYAPAHNNLGAILQSQGQSTEAIRHYREALRTRPDYAKAHYNLAIALHRQGQLALAAGHYRQVLETWPDLVQAHYNLSSALRRLGKAAEAIRHLRAVQKIRPDEAQMLNSLAWALATCPDPELRRPREAVALARRASGMLGGRNPAYLDTLAAAHAAAGQFDLAVSIAKRALKIAAEGPSDELAGRIRDHLARYEQGKPYVEPQPESETPDALTPGSPQ